MFVNYLADTPWTEPTCEDKTNKCKSFRIADNCVLHIYQSLFCTHLSIKQLWKSKSNDIGNVDNILYLSCVVRGDTAAEKTHKSSEASSHYKAHHGLERTTLNDILHVELWLWLYSRWACWCQVTIK